MKTGVAHPLPSALLASLEGVGAVKDFEAGEVLIREGDASTELFILLSGELKVFTSKAESRELTFGAVLPGECFGELSLDGKARSASVRAVTTSRCRVISADEMRSLAHAQPDFVGHLVMNLIALLRRATQKIKSLALDDVYERIIALLEEEAVDDQGTRRLPRNLTQQEIANRIGASREMVNHVFRDLVRGGFLAKDAKHGLSIRGYLPKHR